MKNNYFLFAGFLALIAAFGHAFVGHHSILGLIENSELKHAVFLFLHQTTWFLILSSILFFAASIQLFNWDYKIAVCLAAFVFMGNFLFFVVSSLMMNRQAFDNFLPQFLFLVLYIGSIYLGFVKQFSRLNHGMK